MRKKAIFLFFYSYFLAVASGSSTHVNNGKVSQQKFTVEQIKESLRQPSKPVDEPTLTELRRIAATIEGSPIPDEVYDLLQGAVSNGKKRFKGRK